GRGRRRADRRPRSRARRRAHGDGARLPTGGAPRAPRKRRPAMSKGELFIVDDNANNLSLLSGILREDGYGVRVAGSGRRALEAVRHPLPPLILLDINMPDINGYAVCEELKRHPATQRGPIIFLSAPA